MTYIWTATEEVARQLARSPHLHAFRDGLAPKPADPTQGSLIGSVQELLVVYSIVQSQPMLLGLRLPRVPDFEPLYRDSAEVRTWLGVAERFGHGFVELIEFLRSRLPGYPMLLVPDLLPGAVRVRNEGLWDTRFPWMAEVRRAGLQLVARPALTPQALELPDAGTGFYEALTDLVTALRESDTWKGFAAAHAALDEESRHKAKQLRKQYREAVEDDRVEAIAGETGMRNASMRRAELAATRADASGLVREYFEAFAAVDELLGAVTALLTQRLVRGTVQDVRVVTAAWGPAGDLRSVRLRAQGADFCHPHDVVRVPSDVHALAGLVVLGNVQLFFEHDSEGIELVADGHLLSGSHNVPSNGPAVA